MNYEDFTIWKNVEDIVNKQNTNYMCIMIEAMFKSVFM